MEPSGWGGEECDITSIHGENLKSKIAYYREEENKLNREALEENRTIYNYRLKQIRENPKVGDRVSIGFFRSGIIIEVKRPLVLVQLNSPEDGAGTKWVEIQNLNPL
ncbi:hypothetical protein [Microbulbifer sp. SSSA005]|uniref:hypothetical protein n=1 Tax=Microbulbifer sp. SSSA005 TaxID=3243378 RepID=UPI004039F4FA